MHPPGQEVQRDLRQSAGRVLQAGNVGRDPIDGIEQVWSSHPIQYIIPAMFGGLAILLVFLLLGEGLSALGVPLPGNVIGMILITAALASGRLNPARVEGAADTLLKNLAFLFVPPGVGVMIHARLIGENLGAIAVAIAVGATVVLVVTGMTAQMILNRRRREDA